MATEAKVLTKHPQGKSGKNIDKSKYDAMARAIRAAVRKRQLTHTELMAEVQRALEGKFEGNISWYAETVKLDLEARKEIERTAGKPQKYKLR